MPYGMIEMTEASFVSTPLFNAGAEGETVITFKLAVDPFVCLQSFYHMEFPPLMTL